MSNLIDRDKLIEEVKSHKYCRRCPYSDECYVADDEQVTCEKFLIMDINDQPTANDWIPVERELPIIKGVGENYLVTLDDGSVDLAITDYVKGHLEPSLGYYDGEELDVFTEYKGIISWKPIEPYTGE